MTLETKGFHRLLQTEDEFRIIIEDILNGLVTLLDSDGRTFCGLCLYQLAMCFLGDCYKVGKGVKRDDLLSTLQRGQGGRIFISASCPKGTRKSRYGLVVCHFDQIERLGVHQEEKSCIKRNCDLI